MGAASKGIIQRGYQHNATVYKAPYAKNPFDCVTDDEINDYKKTVERKRHGDCEYCCAPRNQFDKKNSITNSPHYIFKIPIPISLNQKR